MKNVPPLQIALWEFPESDFSDWCELVGDARVASYGEYLTLLAAVETEQESHGRRVVRARFTVQEMRAALVAAGLENTPDNRAAVIAGSCSTAITAPVARE